MVVTIVVPPQSLADAWYVELKLNPNTRRAAQPANPAAPERRKSIRRAGGTVWF
jgi:hypothetical protein